MHTVITWRHRRSVTNGNLRENYENPCNVILGNPTCYIISGMILLVIGVVITAATFQNLEVYQKEYFEKFAGPILIVVGVLVLARGTFNQFRPGLQSSQGVFIRSYAGEMFTRPILDHSSNSVTLCSVSIGEMHENPRRSLQDIDDEPPSYDVVMGAALQQRLRTTHERTRDPSTLSHDFSEPPPTYEEFIRNVDPDSESSWGSSRSASECDTKSESSQSGVSVPTDRVLGRMNTV